jgi:hypothetical protein
MTTADFDVQLSRTADFTAATTTTRHVTGKALRPTLLEFAKGAEARYVRVGTTGTGRVGTTGTGRVGLAHVLVHP